MRVRSGVGLSGIFLALSLAVAPASAELVRLQPRPGVELRISIEGSGQVYALLFAGGHGKLQLDDAGQPQGLRGNFLIRARNILRGRGIGVVMVDAPSDRQGERGMAGWRLSGAHIADIGIAVRTVRQRFGRPVWVVGTSAGTVSVAGAAAALAGADRPDGVVLTATITRQNQRGQGATVFDAGLGAYTGAAFVASHEGDACVATPAADAPRVLAALSGARPKKLQIFSGGLPPQSEPCEARSQHGFLGIEAQVMNAIADFILRPSN